MSEDCEESFFEEVVDSLCVLQKLFLQFLSI